MTGVDRCKRLCDHLKRYLKTGGKDRSEIVDAECVVSCLRYLGGYMPLCNDYHSDMQREEELIIMGREDLIEVYHMDMNHRDYEE